MAIAGNKIDLDDEVVSIEEATDFARVIFMGRILTIKGNWSCS